MPPAPDWMELVKELRQKMTGVIEEFDYDRLAGDFRRWLASESTWEPLFQSFLANRRDMAAEEGGTAERDARTEVWEDDEAMMMELGMPAGSRDLAVETDGHVLIITGTAPVRRGAKPGRPYEKRIELPEHVDPAKARAVYRDGKLCVTIPKIASGQRRRIAVEFTGTPAPEASPPEPQDG